MNTYNKEGTKQTPQINFDLKSGTLLIKGRSVPENTIEFYKDLLKVLDEYSNAPAQITTVDIELEYFNTPTSSVILNVFKTLESIQNAGNKVQVNWNYVDEDILDSGQDYQRVSNIPIKMVEVQE